MAEKRRNGRKMANGGAKYSNSETRGEMFPALGGLEGPPEAMRDKNEGAAKRMCGETNNRSSGARKQKGEIKEIRKGCGQEHEIQ